MLEALCDNKNVQRILFFLFVNNRCYGTQLHCTLKVALTPLQKALNRLEKGGIIMSHYEGKTRLYQFDPTYPLLSELEQLLKKAYTLLPNADKKSYYVIKESPLIQAAPQANRMQIILKFWEKLLEVNKLSFQAKTKSNEEGEWKGKGEGIVTITKEGLNKIIFSEKGTWYNSQGTELNFSNVFRWTLDRAKGIISLEHLRQGFNHPVFLFDLVPFSKNCLSSIDSHLCEGDIYFGQIQFERHSLRLNWRVIGPKKNQEIDYSYSSSIHKIS